MPKEGSVDWMRDERRAAFVTLAVCAAVVLIGVITHHPKAGAVVAGTFGLMRLSGYRDRRRRLRDALAHRQRIAEELEAGQVRVIRCQPTRILEREEFEDEGAFWIFDGGDGHYLAICGQDYHETPRFPSADFEVLITPRHRLVLGIRSRAPRMPSTLVVKGEEIEWDSFPEQEITAFSAAPNAEVPVILEALENASSV
ncbi:hypothetical protein [Prosthecobacter sp.]|uniref:hypothetical protein n=1 Tax=Prosthecobacter sp. TaxID=1965333 RepID=UPI003784A214